MAPIAAIAEEVRKNRRPIASDNHFIAMQENVSKQMVSALDGWRDFTEALAERTFLTVYGSPALQAAVGIDPSDARLLRRPAKNRLYHELRIAELKSHIAVGGLREAVIRALIYVGLGRGAVDERGFESLRRLHSRYGDIPLSEFKALVREQFFILLVDTDTALAALPSMLPADLETRRHAFELIKQVLSARDEFSAEDDGRLQRVARAFGLDEASSTVPNLTVVVSAGQEPQAKAS
jgi:uncharacterized protein DUF3141